MGDTVLSQSIIQNTQDSQLIRDPFQQARNQYDSKNQQPGDILSSSPFSPPTDPNVIQQQTSQQQLPSFKPMLEKLGVDGNYPLNDIGFVQLNAKLRNKLGGAFGDNKDAQELLNLFQQHVKAQGSQAQQSMNVSLSNAERTLAALFGGKK